jgi:diacylglycerol kinase family enzyme
MKYVFLNPASCSGLALKKWSKVKDKLPGVSEYKIVDNFYALNWNDFHLNPGDVLLSAGGDGTLHSMVNALVKHKGLDFLQSLSIGHIGLGSNNSFLRPYSNCTIVHDIPMAVSDQNYEQDLIEVEILRNRESKKVFCVANSSLGFLASANLLFNQDKDIALLKKWNSDLADVYTFFKALFKWHPIEVQYTHDNKSAVRSITNIHFMKKPFYATDLGFPENIPAANGSFRLNILFAKAKFKVFSKFLSMMILKKLEEGRDLTAEINQVIIQSTKEIPIEIDGEIYYGNEFRLKTLRGGIKLCR